MSQGTKEIARSPEAEVLGPEVVEFRAQFDEGRPLDEIVRGGARKMLQAAIEAARVKTGQPGYVVNAETRIDPAVFAELEKRGHQFDYLGDFSPAVGGGQGIMVDPDSGAFMGGADPRRDGYALGW